MVGAIQNTVAVVGLKSPIFIFTDGGATDFQQFNSFRVANAFKQAQVHLYFIYKSTKINCVKNLLKYTFGLLIWPRMLCFSIHHIITKKMIFIAVLCDLLCPRL